VAFLGNDPWSVPTLRALAEADDVDVALVVTNPPRPAGRGSRLTPTRVADEARARGLSSLEVDRVREGAGFDALRAVEADAFVVVAYGELLSSDVLDLPRLGSLNVHFSLLPRWRGAAPVQRAILGGDERTGVTVMLMDEGMDTGPILATTEVPIGDDEDAGTLGARLAGLGGPLLVETLRRFAALEVEPRAQPGAGATRAPKLPPDERTLEWSGDADAVVRRVRALAPDPGATTTFRGEALKVLRAEARPALLAPPEPPRERPRPGRLVVEEGTGLPSAFTGAGLVRLLEVAPAGRRRMTGAEWARGARFGPDERLG
jgi:methionyl-tRNA formyltransferase